MMDKSIVLMGVAGCGKTSVGETLASRIALSYLDGDDLHPQSNIDKMQSGTPLTDEDRHPWLEIIGVTFGQSENALAIGCSALKRSYRDLIRDTSGKQVYFVHLSGTKELIGKRMAERAGHFMPTSLLDSQFNDLELLAPDENGFEVSIDQSVDEVVTEIQEKLKRTGQ